MGSVQLTVKRKCMSSPLLHLLRWNAKQKARDQPFDSMVACIDRDRGVTESGESNRASFPFPALTNTKELPRLLSGLSQRLNEEGRAKHAVAHFPGVLQHLGRFPDACSMLGTGLYV